MAGSLAGPFALLNVDDMDASEDILSAMRAELGLADPSESDTVRLRAELRAVKEWYTVEFYDALNRSANAPMNLRGRTTQNVLLGLDKVLLKDPSTKPAHLQAFDTSWKQAQKQWINHDLSTRILLLNQQQLSTNFPGPRFTNLRANNAIAMDDNAWRIVEYFHKALLEGKQQRTIRRLQAVEYRKSANDLKRKLDKAEQDHEHEKARAQQHHANQLAILNQRISDLEKAAAAPPPPPPPPPTYDDVHSPANGWLDVRLRANYKEYEVITMAKGPLPVKPTKGAPQMTSSSRVAHLSTGTSTSAFTDPRIDTVLLNFLNKAPPYPPLTQGKPKNRFDHRVLAVSWRVHGGDIKNDCTFIVDRAVRDRHGPEIEQLFRLCFEHVYNIPPDRAPKVLQCLEHDDNQIRGIAEENRLFIDKYILARNSEFDKLGKFQQQTTGNRVQIHNNARTTQASWKKYMTSFRTFVENPEAVVKNTKHMNQLRVDKRKCYTDIALWGSKIEMPSQEAAGRVHMQYGNLPDPGLVGWLAYVPPP
ncbi:hypothetical protein QBC38DRAFT_456703 [Podospora fimiseda]|uniref:Uncharacterized protein n=1 Tax=Podospora fimiseda TaxID=252190 RepID=A0AAN7H1U7_9PEZI|nr:hypothetical protein QBC38DRAFT_456703 [Podospora fimiseda]